MKYFKPVVKVLWELFGPTPANEFLSLRWGTKRQQIVKFGWSRKWINKQVARVRLMFRIAASWEIVSPDVLASLQTVPALSLPSVVLAYR